jgi:hypothetical protein
MSIQDEIYEKFILILGRLRISASLIHDLEEMLECEQDFFKKIIGL